MQTLRLRDLCRALNLSTTRVEQWISRGYVEPSDAPQVGKAREWSQSDALRLAILAELVAAGIDAAKVAHIVSLGFHGFRDGAAFLVISTGALGKIIQTSERGEPVALPTPGRKANVPGRLYSEIVKGSQLGEVLSNEDRHVSIVLNLDHAFDRIERVWPAEADASE